jgi:hypothetical protein
MRIPSEWLYGTDPKPWSMSGKTGFIRDGNPIIPDCGNAGGSVDRDKPFQFLLYHLARLMTIHPIFSVRNPPRKLIFTYTSLFYDIYWKFPSEVALY